MGTIVKNERGHAMDTFEAIEARRSVRHFDPEHRMTEAEIERLLSIAALSPTAFNIQNWRFVLVQDPDLRRSIREKAWDQAQVTDASLLIVLCADLKAWEKEPERYWSEVTQEVRDMLVPMIGKYYDGREQVQRDEAMRSSGIAAQTLMLAAKAMGYDSCPMDGFDFDAVAELIALPDDHAIAMFVTIGKATQGPHPRGGQLPLDEISIRDRFPENRKT
jgi:nitroreductase